MYKLKFRHFIFLLILESSIVNTTESSSSSRTLLYILVSVLLTLCCFVAVIIRLFILIIYLIKHKRPRHTSSTETVPLLPITSLHSKRLPHGLLRAAGDKNDPDISEMSYNSARDELFLADHANRVVRAMRVHDNAGDLHDVYRAPLDTSNSLCGVCHMSGSDTLLVSSIERGACWLVALSRNDSEWREAQRVQTDGSGNISCALSDSRVLIGQWNSTYMELFRVESGPRIERVHRIHVPEEYKWFSATCGSDTLVAMSYADKSVRVHRLRGDRLEELARIQLKAPNRLLWLADRLIVADSDEKSHAVIELEVSDTRLERRRELIATSENIHVSSLCAVIDGLAICDYTGISKDILHYSFV